MASTPMLRGVWGRALKHVNSKVYADVFEGTGPQDQRRPAYIIRPSAPDPLTAPSIEWILLDTNPATEIAAWKAWLVACGMGLGPRRQPFRILKRELIASSEQETWYLASEPPKQPNITPHAHMPQKLAFLAPLRILRKRKLIEAPTLRDIATAGMRRIAGIAGIERNTRYRDLMHGAISQANAIQSEPWCGERLDVVRWSAKQQKELTLYGVTGSLSLPDGPQRLWPLLSALRWLHIGKGTVYGMGQPTLMPLQSL